MPARPLTAEIGATENALRALLDQTLASTPIADREQWIFLNAGNGPNDDLAITRVASVLKTTEDAVRAIRQRLVDAGLLTTDYALSPDGQKQLTVARQLVAKATARLTDGIDPGQLATAAAVLNTMRTRAEGHLHD